MSEDLQMVLQMYREWKKEASGWIEQGAEQFFCGVPIRQLEEMLREQAGEALRNANTKTAIQMSDKICWSCNNPGGELLDFGGVYIHNKPECRHAAGIPDDEPKHDGKLDEQGTYTVGLYENKNARQMSVDIVESDNNLLEPEYVKLTPAQALSLLAWLRQEEAELQRLAKEQERG